MAKHANLILKTLFFHIQRRMYDNKFLYVTSIVFDSLCLIFKHIAYIIIININNINYIRAGELPPLVGEVSIDITCLYAL